MKWKDRPSIQEPPLLRQPSQDRPAFRVGERVTLAADTTHRVRTVLAVEWHAHQRRWCYRVTTGTSLGGKPCPAYWFASQLERW